MSQNNEYFVLEANNPMMYHVVPESLPIVSKGIVQGLLNKYQVAFTNKLTLLPPLLVLNKHADEKDYLDAWFTCQELNAPLISEEETPITNSVILNSNYGSTAVSSLRMHNKLLIL